MAFGATERRITMRNINKILVANRGEIASRVFRSCRKLGISSVAVFSDADENAPFVKEADTAVHIGASEPRLSYLDMDKIIAAAKRTQADAIHPGYGFLSENAAFAERCAEEGIVFIGPHPEAIRAMGSKSQAKAIMEAGGVPVIPGYKGEDQSLERLTTEALAVGFPLLLKATAGGGGKGMRIVREASELAAAIEAAQREAKSAFGDDELLIEKYIESGRHIEFQIFGDQHGQVVHLLERECTIQRRYQKVIEESPSPIMDAELRSQMGAAAVLAAKALRYDNAGTVEFIYDDKSGAFYFLEVNTRLQVEHPVTEMITGLDLVQMQIDSARGLPLSVSQEDVTGNGYAIEARLYAEDPSNNFTPVTGTVHRFAHPDVDGLRMESAVASGSAISIFYDPMVAKIVVWDQTRSAAHHKMAFVLRHLICQGTITNLAFLQQIIQDPDFQDGKYDTHFIAQKSFLTEQSTLAADQRNELAIAATLFHWSRRNAKRGLLRGLPSGWRNSFYQAQQEVYRIQGEELRLGYHFQNGTFEFSIGDAKLEAKIVHQQDDLIRVSIDGLQRDYSILQVGQQVFVHSESTGNVQLLRMERFPEKEKEKVKGGYESPMPSQIVKFHVAAGDSVKAGDPLVVISSMKMENTIVADEDGQVEEVFTTEGSNVEAGFLLLKINAH